MKICRALNSNIITQGFNSNPEMVEFYKKYGMSNHGGIDFWAKDGEKIYWDGSIRGQVLNTEIDSNGGLGVNIITEEEVIYKHRFWHLKEFKCQAGQILESGDLIGLQDNTGVSTGTHLHRDVKEMVRENGVLKIKYPNNGTFGTIDFTPFFTNIFIVDYMKNLETQVSIYEKIIQSLKSIIEILKGR